MKDSTEVQEAFGQVIVLPENPSMRDVVTFSLSSYKDLMEEAELMEPENKRAQVELARTFLQLAKDTMYHEGDLSLKHRKQDLEERKQEHREQGSPKPVAGSDEPDEDGASQEDIWERIAAKKKAQKEKKK